MSTAAPNHSTPMSGVRQRYAVIKDGGRQYRVMEGQELEVDFRHLPAGAEMIFEEVLAYSNEGELEIGAPLLKKVAVKAEVVGPVQGGKIYVQKFARRKNYRRRIGHRSLSTKVRITSIS